MIRKLIPGTVLCAALAGCGLIPNPAYEPGAVYKRELDGNYMVIASCAYDNLQKSWAPVQKTDFPERKTTRLSRHTDGTPHEGFPDRFHRPRSEYDPRRNPRAYYGRRDTDREPDEGGR